MGSKMTVVAGGGGFIGGHLVRVLRARGETVRAVDIKPLDEWYQTIDGVENVVADLRIRSECDRVITDATDVFQLAADMGGMGFIEHNKARCMLSILIDTQMLLASSAAGVGRFFFSSSACVYNVTSQSSLEAQALKESDAYPAMPEDGYGWEKLFAERMCRHFREDFALPTRVARYHNVYGPYGAWDGGREKAPAAICRKVIQAQRSGSNAIEIWGDGTQLRSFTFIDDCVTGTLAVAASDITDPINIGSSEQVTINQLVDIAESIAGVKLKRTYNLGAPKGVLSRNSDNTKILAELGWEPTTALREGMERTFRWIYDQSV